MDATEGIGPLVRRLRRAKGWSQGRLAEQLSEVSGRDTIGRHDVYRWEAGKRLPRVWLPALAEALGVPREELELACAGALSPTTPETTSSDQVLHVPAEHLWFEIAAEYRPVPTVTPSNDPISRESSPQIHAQPSLGAGDVSSNDNDQLILPCLDPSGRVVYMSISRRVLLQSLGILSMSTVSIEPDMPQVAAAMAHPPIEHFRRIREVLAESDNLFGPRHVISAAQAQVRLIGDLRKSQGRRADKHLFALQTQFGDLIGWLYQDQKEYSSAQYWLDRAMEWSHASGDLTATAFILARKSQLAGDMGYSDEAVSNGLAALRLSPKGSKIFGIAAAYAAHGHALSNDERECRRLYESACECVSAANSDEMPWGAFFDSAYLRVQHARNLYCLGKHAAAVELYGKAISDLPQDYVRDRGVYLAREALCHMEIGNHELAATSAFESARIGLTTGSQRILPAVRRVDDHLTGARSSVPLAAELHALLLGSRVE